MPSTPLSPPTAVPCHLCGGTILLIPGYEDFFRATSDCKPWRRGGKLAVCSACGCAQAVIDQAWRDEAAGIYQDYAIYHQSQGATEQSVFDPAGKPRTRSAQLALRLEQQLALPDQGWHLDLGCGNGAFLRAFGQKMPGWTLAGAEINDRYRAVVEKIPGVKAFYSQSIEEIPAAFDLITLIHALEHIPAPGAVLERLRAKLRKGGRVLVQVPDCRQNPFMFLVADHSSHFFPETLDEVFRRAGYDLEVASSEWVAKEITAVGSPAKASVASLATRNWDSMIDDVRARVAWLRQVMETAKGAGAGQTLGLFGTSIAATWLFQELGGQVAFFVDEDPARIGQTFLGRPIYGPGGVPVRSTVFLGLPPALAAQVKDRLQKFSFDAIVPPALPVAVAR